MKKVTLTLEYNIELPEKYENETPEELINDLNKMYDIHGKGIIGVLGAQQENYFYTRVTHIDDEEVFTEDCIGGQRVSNQGMDIILDGQKFKEEI